MRCAMTSTELLKCRASYNGYGGGGSWKRSFQRVKMQLKKYTKWKRLAIFTLLIILVRYLHYWYKLQEAQKNETNQHQHVLDARKIHGIVVTEFMERRKNWETSELGRILFKNASYGDADNVTYRVNIWRGRWLQTRHVFNYGKLELDPLEFCSVKNCRFSYSDGDLSRADAVIFHLFTKEPPSERRLKSRKSHQRYVFLTDESPKRTCSNCGSMKKWSKPGFFNWSMSYRTDSDVPVPYGRVVPLPSAYPDDNYSRQALTTIIPNWKTKRKDVLVAILISHCTTNRVSFVEALQQHMPVHVLGECSKDENLKAACPGHLGSDCPALDHYYFYIAFENSRCFQYITEKVFHNALGKGAIPVIAGTDYESASQLLPPHSFIYSNDFRSVGDLADKLKMLAKELDPLLDYHSWRRHFEVLNEHGYFKTRSVHFCRICEALNYNSKKEKKYDRKMLDMFLEPEKLCYN